VQHYFAWGLRKLHNSPTCVLKVAQVEKILSVKLARLKPDLNVMNTRKQVFLGQMEMVIP